MTTKNKDVEALYAELETTLQNDDSEAEVTPGASAENDHDEQEVEEEAPAEEEVREEKQADTGAADDGEELKEEEIAKLPKRAQDRIRKLAADLKAIKDKETGDGDEPEDKPATEEKDAEFNTVEDFLAAVQDDASRKLLETFAKVLDKKTGTALAPLIEANAGKVFDEKFKDFERIPGMSDFRDDLRKTFVRNPNQSLKALVGEKLVDLQSGRIKPTVKKPSTPAHGGGDRMDTAGKSKEELYDMLDSTRE